MIDKKLHYAHPQTGYIQIGDEWLDDQILGGWPASDLESLIEVEWNSFKQAWEEVRP